MGKNSASRISSIFLILLFVGPLAALALAAKNIHQISFDDLAWATKNTVIQVILSFLFLLLGSILGGLGLLSLPGGRAQQFIRGLIVIPYFLPPVFALLAAFEVIGNFPRGYLGIAILHAWINIGVGSLISENYFRTKFSDYRAVVLTYGISRARFFGQVLFPQILPLIRNLGLAFIPFFVASFTIPLIVGGSGGTTLEVLIYEKMRLSNDWGTPLIICGFQITAVAVFFAVLKSRSVSGKLVTDTEMDWLSIPFGKWFIFGLNVLLLVGFVMTFATSSPAIIFKTYGTDLNTLIFNSAYLVFGIGLLFFLSISGILYFRPNLFITFIEVFNNPGNALLAFAFVILGLWFEPLRGLSLAWCFLILFLPVTFRSFVSQPLSALDEEIKTAEVFGAGKNLIFWEIIFPQMRQHIVVAASVASLWALGDFSVARILMSNDQFLGLAAGSLISSYRLEQAGWISLGILGLGGVNFLLLWSISRILEKREYVSSKKPAY